MDNFVGEALHRMIIYFDGDVRRINHALKVSGFTRSIAKCEGISGDTLQTLELAAIFHDIGIKESERKYSSSAGKYQELEGPPIARELLKDFNLSIEAFERIDFLIGHHHTYNAIDGLDFQILVEADFLVNIFEEVIGIEEVKIIKKKYFKTNAGITYLGNMVSK